MLSLLKISCLSIILLMVLTSVTGCDFPIPNEPVPDNPWHKDGINPQIPEVSITNLKDGDVINNNEIYVYWMKKTDVTKKYSYGLEYKYDEEWINVLSHVPTTETSTKLENLAEGEHKFWILPQNDTEDGIEVTVSFSIQTLEPPYIAFSTKKISDITTISILCAGLTRFMGAHIEIYATNSCAIIGDLVPNTNLADMIKIFYDSSDIYRLIIDLVYLGGDSDFSETIYIGSFMVTPQKSGNISIDRYKTIFRDIENRNIPIQSLDIVEVY